MTINSQGEWANAIEDAEQVMLRWGHGQVRRVPDEIVEAIVAALRAPVSELGEPVAWLIALTVDGKPRREVHLNNCIADYRVVDPKATVTPLYKAKA